MSVNSAVECTGFTLGAEWADSLVTGNNWGSRSSLCPGPNELPRRGHAWLWLRSFDSPALVFSADQNLSERRAAASWRCDAPVRMKGGYAGGSAKRRAAGRPHRAPLRERVGRGLRLKSTGEL